jgi:hypothetical protein
VQNDVVRRSRRLRGVSSLAGAILLALVLLAPGSAQSDDVTLTVVLGGLGSVTATAGGTTDTCDLGFDDVTCELNYPRNTSVTLTATAESGKRFAGWSAVECEGTDACTLTLDDSFTLVARFAPFRLVVFTDAVSVARSQPGADCGEEFPCTAIYEPGTEVVLTATPDEAGNPVEWDRASWCEPDGGNYASTVCRVTMDFDPLYVAVGSPDASFTEIIPIEVEVATRVTLEGGGQGQVTGPGLACPGDCVADGALYGKALTLVATPAAGFRFARWRGGGCSTSPTCELRAGSTTSLRAVFERPGASPPPPPPPGTPPPPPGAPPPPPAGRTPASPLAARLASVSVVSTTTGRTIVVRLVVRAPGEAVVRLIRIPRQLARGRYQVAAAGTKTLRLPVPRWIAPGQAWVVVTARDRTGRLRQLSRSIRLPPAPG